MANDVFERHEIKYLIDLRTRIAFERAVRPRLTEDEHGRSTICNIYLDTPDWRLVRHSLEKPSYKEKLRMRSYGVVQAPDQPVFLELKKKYHGIVYKRRVELPAVSAQAALDNHSLVAQRGQIGREIAYALDFYPQVRPAVHLSYERQAFYATDDPGLRITFDENVLWRTNELDLAAPLGGNELLAPGQSILEIKVGGAMPLWLTAILDQARMYPTGFSKIGRAYQALIPAERGLLSA